MLAKKNRLNLSVRKNSQLFESSKRLTTDNLLFYYRSNQLWLRISVIAPTRLFAKAYQRNKNRRLIYNLINEIRKDFQKTQQQDLYNKNIDVVVVYKKIGATAATIKGELLTFFKKISKHHETL
jgi:RNase P protein component